MEESNGHDEPVEEFGEGVIDEIKKDEEVRVWQWNVKISI